eukprot:1159606-Pelagomonas_calceolata.AAC.1
MPPAVTLLKEQLLQGPALAYICAGSHPYAGKDEAHSERLLSLASASNANWQEASLRTDWMWGAQRLLGAVG